MTASASSKMMTLKGGLGYFFVLLSSLVASLPVTVVLFLSFSLLLTPPKMVLADAFGLEAMVAVFLYRLGSEFNSNTWHLNCYGCHNSLHNANATDVLPGPGGS
jgi:hypothetical protein